MKKVSVEPMSKNSIRLFAKRFREIFGLENVLYFPIVQFIEWCLPQLDLNYEIVPITEMGGAYGVTHTGKNVMKIREDVYIGAISGNPRDRFTLCHELGHYLLHTPDRVSFARGDVPAYMDPEWQANTFAAEIMAPYHLISKMSVEEIADKCGMSMTAAQIQYKKCHNIA